MVAIPQGTVASASAVVKKRLYCIGGADTGSLFADKVHGDVRIYQPKFSHKPSRSGTIEFVLRIPRGDQ